MKKNIIAAMVLAFSSIAAAQVALAQENISSIIQIRYTCPKTSSSPSDRLMNSGTNISGLGVQVVDTGTSLKSQVRFSAPVDASANIPLDLTTGSYKNAGAIYTPTSGRVTCYYQSGASFSPFNVSYVVQNGMNGVVSKTDTDGLTIQIPVGLKH